MTPSPAPPTIEEPGRDVTDEPATGGRGLPRILGLPWNVFFTGVVSFFMDVSSEMVYPLVPLFLSAVLGVNREIIGLIEGIAETTASMLKVFSGWLSDRLGRRKLLMGLGYGVSGLSRPVLAQSASWGQVLGARFVDRFGKGVRTAPRDAIVADSSSATELGKNFGFHRALDQVGAVIGPGIAFVVLYFSPGAYREVFWISMIPAAFAILVIVFFVRERRPEKRRKERVVEPGPEPSRGEAGRSGGVAEGSTGLRGRVRRARRLRGPLLAYIAITGLFALANSSDAFLILRARNLGVAVALIPILYLVFNLVYSGVSIPAGLAADRFGRRRLVFVGYVAFALAYGGMALASSAEAAWFLFPLYGIYMGIADGNGRALLAELSPVERRATAFGVYHSVVGLGALPASIIAGVLWERVSPSAPFWVGAGGALLAGILLLALVPSPDAGVGARAAS